MTKTRVLLVVCLAWILALVGCGASDPMVGTWNIQLDEAAKSKMPAGMTAPTGTAEFKADGTYSVKIDLMGRSEEMTGTYKLDGKTLTMTPKTEGGKPSNDKAETVTLSEDGKSFDVPGAAGMAKMVKQ